MLTPVELNNFTLKTGLGYKKKEVDSALEEIFQNYEELYKENLELKDKLSVLSDGLQYYKEMEKTLQKTLVVAEKTAEELENASKGKASLIEEKARAEAACIVEEAKKQAQGIYNQTLSLIQQYESYRIQHKRLAAAQIELLESEVYQIHYNITPPDFLEEKVGTEPSGSEEPKEEPSELEEISEDKEDSFSDSQETEEEGEEYLDFFETIDIGE